jgi:NAD-dependent deacetylase
MDRSKRTDRPGSENREIVRARELLARSRRVVVLTGAGVSAESGIPTFRDAQTGLWAKYRPEDLATPEAFRRDPETVWSWYAWRRSLVTAVDPNPAHYALARLEERIPRFTLVTQNVDGLHHRAGSRKLVEIHGSILRVRCFARCVSYTVGEDSPEARRVFAGDIAAAGDATAAGNDRVAREVPRCPVCGDYLRPDVVWFGENLPEEAIETAFHAAEAADLCLVIGTSSVVYPAAMLPDIALEAGASVVEINPEETPFSPRATLSIRGAAGEVVPAIVG